MTSIRTMQQRRKREYIASKPNVLQQLVRHDMALRKQTWRHWFWWLGSLNNIVDFEFWRSYWLSQNPNITLEFIKEFPSINWDWQGIAANPNLTIDFVRRHRDKIENWVILFEACDTLDPEDILSIADHVNGTDWMRLSFSRNVTLDFVLKHKDAPAIIWDGVSASPNITMDMIERHEAMGLLWTKRGIAFNPNVTINYIKKYQNIGAPWDWYALSRNPAITMDIVRENVSPWQPSELSENPNITMDFIIEFFGIGGWNWQKLSEHPNITMRDIAQYPHFPWDWVFVSRNLNVTIEFVKANIEKGWDWCGLSMNPGITVVDIELNAQLPWDWHGISYNPNITFEFIQKYRKKLHDSSITANKFLWDDTVYKRELARDIAARCAATAAVLPQYLARGICRYIDWV